MALECKGTPSSVRLPLFGKGQAFIPLPLVWIVSAVIIGVFIWELILNQREQGSPISTKVNSYLIKRLVMRLTVNPASVQPNARSFGKRSHFSWSSISSMHENRTRCAADTTHRLCADCPAIGLRDADEPCVGMNNTDNPISSICTVGDLCSFGGMSLFPSPGLPTRRKFGLCRNTTGSRTESMVQVSPPRASQTHYF